MLSNGEQVVIDEDKIDQETFESIVHYIYASTEVTWEDKEEEVKAVKATLIAADYLEYTKLKLDAEAEMVFYLDLDNAAELLLLAESISCAYLKEEAMKFCLTLDGLYEVFI